MHADFVDLTGATSDRIAEALATWDELVVGDAAANVAKIIVAGTEMARILTNLTDPSGT